MKKYGASRSTSASPAQVWQVWSDPDNWSRWNTGIRACAMSEPLRTGATAVMTTSRGSTHTVTFADVQPERGFTLSMAGPPLTTITFVCEIAPSGTGSTIAQSVVMSGALGGVLGALMGTQMATHFVPVLDDLAAAAEATA